MEGHPDALGPKVRNVWNALGRTSGKYVLVGGTALAWRLAHRVSLDVDLCTSGPVDHPRALRRRWAEEAIGKHKWLRRRPDHYVKFFETATTPKIDVHGRVPGGCLNLPTCAPNGLRIASLTDILKQKLVAMAVREEVRDGVDVAAILKHGEADLRLAAAGVRDETGTGIGPDETEHLGRRLAELSRSPWRDLPELATLAPELLSDRPATLRLACDRIEGPDRLPNRSGPSSESRPRQRLQGSFQEGRELGDAGFLVLESRIRGEND